MHQPTISYLLLCKMQYTHQEPSEQSTYLDRAFARAAVQMGRGGGCGAKPGFLKDCRRWPAQLAHDIPFYHRKAGMKRQNFVVLNGMLQDFQERFERVDGQTAPAMVATLVTDHEVYGGHHRVLFPGRLCFELLAFLQAAKSNRVEITVDGWLRSRENETLVVADRVMFYVGESVRREAAEKFRQMIAPCRS